MLSASQVSASAWEEPSPEIFIQGRNRTGFSTGSAKGYKDRKKPRGQEGSGRSEGDVGSPDPGTLGFLHSSHLTLLTLPGTSMGIAFASYFAHDGFTFWASLVAQMVKNLPAVQETQVPPGSVPGSGGF